MWIKSNISKPPTFVQANKIAYQLGKEAKELGWDKISPYKNQVAAYYWDAGYSGITITNFREGHKKSQRLLTQPQYDAVIRILQAVNDEQINELKMRINWGMGKGRDKRFMWEEEIDEKLYDQQILEEMEANKKEVKTLIDLVKKKENDLNDLKISFDLLIKHVDNIPNSVRCMDAHAGAWVNEFANQLNNIQEITNRNFVQFLKTTKPVPDADKLQIWSL